jgi:hypothetical protein
MYTEWRQKYFGAPVIATAANLIDVDPQANPVFMKDVVSYMTKAGYFVRPYTYSQLVDQSFYNKVKK